MKRDLSTPENRSYWKNMERTAKEVEKWPCWISGSGGINRAEKNNKPKPEPEVISISSGKHKLRITGWCVFCQEPIKLAKIVKALKKAGFKVT